VQQGAAPGAFAGELVESASSKGQVQCKYCGNGRVFRIFREGYLQEKIYPIFGYFPWKCKTCGKSMMLRVRNKRSGDSLDGARASGRSN
jgi:DNA-directed RNA polymerase subunit RPC12/RpoP